MLQCEDNISRKGKKFAIDPELPEETDLQKDYLHSGYDRGHNMSAEDNKCNNIGMEECFYFSNMFPQIHSLNAGTWEELERKERKEANEYGSVKVFVGSLGKLCTIGEDNVVVPMYCWKIIYLQSTNEYECYIFPNEQPSDKNIEDYTTSLEIIEKKTGIYFKGEKAIIKGEN
jgi:endonuclease G